MKINISTWVCFPFANKTRYQYVPIILYFPMTFSAKEDNDAQNRMSILSHSRGKEKQAKESKANLSHTRLPIIIEPSVISLCFKWDLSINSTISTNVNLAFSHVTRIQLQQTCSQSLLSLPRQIQFSLWK